MSNVVQLSSRRPKGAHLRLDVARGYRRAMNPTRLFTVEWVYPNGAANVIGSYETYIEALRLCRSFVARPDHEHIKVVDLYSSGNLGGAS